MRLLLDTCTFLWLAAEPARISAPAAEALNDSANSLYLSDVSVWEIVLKNAAGKLRLPQKPRVWIPKQSAFFQLQRLAIGHDSLFRAGELPPRHHDPFDRLLAAQALAEPFHFISPDAPFRAYAVACIW